MYMCVHVVSETCDSVAVVLFARRPLCGSGGIIITQQYLAGSPFFGSTWTRRRCDCSKEVLRAQSSLGRSASGVKPSSEV